MLDDKSGKSFLILELILGTLTFIIFLLILPPILLFLIAIQLYRWSLNLYVNSFKNELSRMVTGNSALFAGDDIHTRPRSNLVCCIAFEGMTLDHLIEFVKTVAMERDQSNQLVYPELRQYYEEWMGYMWWKWEEDFQFEEHISVWDKENPISEKEYFKIVATLEGKPFPKGRSPWEFIFLPNVILENVKNSETPKLVMIVRFHHVLADGVSLLQIMMKFMFSDSMDKMPQPAYKQRTAVERKLFHLGALFQLPYQFMKQIVCSRDFNEWHLSESKLSRKIYQGCTKRIDIRPMKKFKKEHEVGFTSVLVSTLSGALRRMMIKQKVNVPEKMHALAPIPWPDHPDKLCNHWSIAFLEMCTGEGNSVRRVHATNNHFEELKQSAVPVVNFHGLRLVSMLPTCILRGASIANKLPTVFISNFPGPPKESVDMSGFNLVDAMFTGGPHHGNIGIHFRIVSYDNAIRIVVAVDSSILKTQDRLDEFVEVIEREFSELPESST